ncbi:MAG: hypothetical protein O7D34_11785 [Ignavibacteria bacterium]|nr:hypothetical protein [Ignavibacteria bacterium]
MKRTNSDDVTFRAYDKNSRILFYLIRKDDKMDAQVTIRLLGIATRLGLVDIVLLVK